LFRRRAPSTEMVVGMTGTRPVYTGLCSSNHVRSKHVTALGKAVNKFPKCLLSPILQTIRAGRCAITTVGLGLESTLAKSLAPVPCGRLLYSISGDRIRHDRVFQLAVIVAWRMQVRLWLPHVAGTQISTAKRHGPYITSSMFQGCTIRIKHVLQAYPHRRNFRKDASRPRVEWSPSMSPTLACAIRMIAWESNPLASADPKSCGFYHGPHMAVAASDIQPRVSTSDALRNFLLIRDGAPKTL
jgi:hypothetical protein